MKRNDSRLGQTDIINLNTSHDNSSKLEHYEEKDPQKLKLNIQEAVTPAEIKNKNEPKEEMTTVERKKKNMSKESSALSTAERKRKVQDKSQERDKSQTQSRSTVNKPSSLNPVKNPIKPKERSPIRPATPPIL